MSMQDKDMDELFRAKLDNLEVEPSAGMWKGITVELDGGKRKRSLIPLISIAASIILVAAVSLFFMLTRGDESSNQVAVRSSNKHQTIKLSAKGETETDDEQVEEIMQAKKDAEQVAVQNKATNQIGAALNQTEQSSQQVVAKAGAVKQSQIKNGNVAKTTDGKIKHRGMIAGEQLAELGGSKHAHKKMINPDADVVNEDELQKSTNNQHVLAALPANDIKITEAVVPDEPLNISKPTIPGADDFKTGNKVASVPLPVTKPAKAPVKKHGIRTFGDLINVVVAKVDKRQDKVIHFSDNDDDEDSNITSINLGFVKVKKEK